MSIRTDEAPATSRRRRASSSAAKSLENPAPATPTSQSHRLFTEEDEIRLLQALQRAPRSENSSLQLSALAGRKFSSGQIADKLRRLRRRYHKMARTKSQIKTDHDRKIYDMAREIWGKKPNEAQAKQDGRRIEDEGGKERVDLGEFPGLIWAVSEFMAGNTAYREGMERVGRENLRSWNERWMVLRTEAAALLAKKTALFYEQTKLEMEAVLSSSNGIAEIPID